MPIKNFGNFSTQSTRINKDSEKHSPAIPVDTGLSSDASDNRTSSSKNNKNLDLTVHSHGEFFTGIDIKNESNTQKNINALEKTNKSASEILIERGLDSNQPEILSISEFLPLYDNWGNRSEAGSLIDQQLSIRSLLLSDVEETITSIRKNSILSADLDKLIKNYKLVVKDTESKLKVKSLILNNLDSMKNALDLKENENQINNEVDRIRASRGVKKSRNGETSVTSTTFPLGMYATPRQVMICHLKFTNEGYETFSNSKIIGQIISDLKNTIEEHSPQLLETFSEERKNDRDAMQIMINTVRSDNFSFKRENISSKNAADKIVSQTSQRKRNSLGNFDASSLTSFSKFIESLPSDDIRRAKFLIALLSKELRMSAGLTRLSNTEFDDLYRLEETDFVSRIIGEIGSSIIGANPQNKSLSRIERIENEDGIIVLPLEKRAIIDANTGETFMPGSIYFVDTIVREAPRPNTKALQNYVEEIRSCTSSAGTTLYALLNFDDENETLYFGDIFRRMISSINDLAKTTDAEQKVAFLSMAMISLSQGDVSLKNMLFKYVKELSSGVIISRKHDDSSSADSSKKNEHENLSGTGTGRSASDITFGIDDPAAERVDKKVKSTDATASDGVFSADDGIQAKLKSTSLPYEIEKKLLSLLAASNNLPSKTHIKFSKGEIEKFLNNGISDKKSVFNKIVEITEQLMSAADAISTKGPSTRRNYKTFKNENNLTKYSNYSDDTLLLIVFEIVSCIVKEFMSPRFEGKTNEVVTVTFNQEHNKTIIESIDSLLTSQKSTQNLAGYTAITTLLDSMYFTIAQEDNVIRDLLDVTRAFVNIINAAEDSTVSFFNSKQTSSSDSKIMFDLFNDSQNNDIFKNLSNTQLAASWRAHDMIMKATDNSLLPKNQVVTSDEKNAIESLLKTERFNFSCAKNAKLVSVGLPAGMLDMLQNPSFVIGSDTDLESSNEDIISIQVYRKDPQFSDIIFKPITYLFDISRFVSNEFKAKKNVDFETFLDSSVKLVNIIGSKGQISSNSFAEMSNKKEYSNLSAMQKRNLFKNHVQDELLKIYFQLMTGIDMSESSFISNENLIKNRPIDDNIKLFFEKSSKTKEASPLNLMMLSTDTHDITAGISLNNSLSSIVSLVNTHDVSKDSENNTTAASNRKDNKKQMNVMSDTLQSQTMKMGLTKQVNQNNKKIEGMRAQYKAFLNNSLIRITEQMIRTEQPKLFERIFMIVVDPDDFIIDDKKTNQTKFGRNELSNAIANDLIVEEKINNEFVKKIKTRNAAQGDFTFSEFFVTVGLGVEK